MLAHVGGEATKSRLRLLQRRVSLRSRRPDALDVASLSSERLPILPSVYALAVPERVIEVQSSTDLERAVRAKLAPLLEKDRPLRSTSMRGRAASRSID